MAGPWEKYQTAKPKGPWERYGQTPEPQEPEMQPQGSSVQGTMSAQEKPSALRLFLSTPVVQGLTDPVMKGLQYASRIGMIPGNPTMDIRGENPLAQTIDKVARMREANYQNLYGRDGGNTGEAMTRAAAAALPTAPLLPSAGPAAGALRRVGMAAAEGALGSMAQPVTDKRKQKDLIGTTLGEGLKGGAAGGGMALAVPGATKLFNALKKDGAVAPAAKALYDDLELIGMGRKDVSAGQALGKGWADVYERTTMNLPGVGGSSDLAKGYNKFVEKARFIDEKLKTQVEKAGFKGIDQLEAAAARGDRNAVRILTDVVPDAEKDAYGVVKAALDIEKSRRGKFVGELYKQVDQAASSLGPVDLSGAKAVAGSMLEENTGLGGNTVLAKELQGILQDLGNAQGDKALYAEVRRKADKLGQKANTWMSSPDPETRAAAFGLRDLRDTIRSEMDMHVANGGIPEATEALSAATSAYKELMTPYKNKVIKNILNPDTAAEETVGRLVKKYGTTRLPEKVMSAMGDKGKAAYKSLIFDEKIARATSGDRLSLANLAKSIEDDLPRLEAVFGKDAETMRALANVARHLESSQLAFTVQQNGSKLAPLLMGVAGGAGVMTAGNATAAGTGLMLLGRMFTSGPLKKYTVAASKLPPGHPQLEKIIEQGLRYIPRTSGAALSQDDTPVEE